MPGLDDLYREVILDHYRSPRNQGELPTPPAIRVEGFNPLCGDEIIVYVQVDDDGVVTDIAIGGQPQPRQQTLPVVFGQRIAGGGGPAQLDLRRGLVDVLAAGAA